MVIVEQDASAAVAAMVRPIRFVDLAESTPPRARMVPRLRALNLIDRDFPGLVSVELGGFRLVATLPCRLRN
jgi:hypothetical protein